MGSHRQFRHKMTLLGVMALCLGHLVIVQPVIQADRQMEEPVRSVHRSLQKVTLPAIEDTFVSGADPGRNYGDDNLVQVGLAGGYERRILMKFDTSGIPSGSTITSANLELHRVFNQGAAVAAPATYYIGSYRITTSWDESTATWADQPFVWGSILDSATDVDAAGDWVNWDVTNLVASWIEDGKPNYGISLRKISTSTAIYAFYSNKSPSFGPRLTINYELPPPTSTPTHTPHVTSTPSPTTEAPTLTPTPTPRSGVIGSCPGQVWVYADKDTWVEQADPDARHGDENRLQLKNDGGAGWVYLHFPVDDLIPPGQQLYNAHLELYAFDASSATKQVQVTMATLAESFSEAVTSWETKPAEGVPLGQRMVVGNGQSLDMTHAVYMWEANTDPNHGIVMKPGTNDEFYYHYGSREYWVSPPVLKIFCGDPISPTPTPSRTPTAPPPSPTPTPTPVCPARISVFADADTWVDSRNPTATHGDDVSLHVDLTAQGANTGRSDAYIHFPKDARLNGAYIYHARVRLHRPDPTIDPAAEKGRLDTLDDPFTEANTNFNSKPGSGDWNTGWVDLPWWITFPEWDVTGAIQQVYHEGAPNHGFHVWVDGGQAIFDSREGLAKPELIIDCGLTQPTNTPTVTPTPEPTPTPTPFPDFIADEIEVTQAIQDLNNSVRLVAGKRTFVRFHVHRRGGPGTTNATLVVSNGTDIINMSPLNPGGVVDVKWNARRDVLNNAFLFELPDGFREGTIYLSAAVNTAGIPESDWTNNLSDTSVTFEEVKPIRIVIYRVSYNMDGTSHITSLGDAAQLSNYLQRVYPAHEVEVEFRTIDMGDAEFDTDDDGNVYMSYPNCGAVNGQLAIQHLFEMGNGYVGTWQNVRYYGMVSDGGRFMRGCSPVPGRASSGPTGVPAAGDWDTDGSYGDWYGAHEIAHSYGRSHAVFCGAEGSAPYPYPNGRISDDYTGPDAFYGFDITTREIHDTHWKDLMTYCAYEWVSDFTYEGLMDAFGKPNAAYSVNDVARGTYFQVIGQIDPVTQAITLEPTFVDSVAGTDPPPAVGDFAIVLRDSRRHELARHPFMPVENNYGPPSPTEPVVGVPAPLSIFELVPYVDGVAQIEIEGPRGELLHRVSAGHGAPTVTLLSPNGGVIPDGDTIPVSWKAQDPDGDPLTFRVLYSPDNGRSWSLQASGVAGNRIDLDAANVQGATISGRFKILASDGVHTGEDISDDPITILNRPPTIEIIAPENGASVAISQTVALKAVAYDIDQGSLSGDAVRWTSNLAGPLGSGDDLVVTGLSLGRHTITAIVQDAEGARTTASVQLRVVKSPQDVVVDDGLLVGPTSLWLGVESEFYKDRLTIENLNPKRSLRWQAAASVPWLLFSTRYGKTPQEITVFADSTRLRPGAHLATITFSSPDVPGQRSIVRVNVHVAEHPRLYLPVLLR